MGREKRTDSTSSQEHQHFSHPHILKLLSPVEGQTHTCKACEKQILKPYYGCNICQYFLHENCLNAPRSLNHSSHSSHSLTLHSMPTYTSRAYTCNACWSNGNGFSYSCACCEVDLHLQCASCPSSLLIDEHPHQLKLLFASPYEDKNTVAVCDICDVTMANDDWLYYCAGCDFGSHLECAKNPEVEPFPRQQRNRNPNPNTTPTPNVTPTPNATPTPAPNPTLDAINAANEAHEQIIAAQLRAQIEARGREACLDMFRPPRRYSYI